MELSCPLGNTRRAPQEKFPQKPYNKSFLDQVCSVKMAGYWPRFSFASLWTSTVSRSMNTQIKELGQYPAILTSLLINNPLTLELYSLKIVPTLRQLPLGTMGWGRVEGGMCTVITFGNIGVDGLHRRREILGGSWAMVP